MSEWSEWTGWTDGLSEVRKAQKHMDMFTVEPAGDVSIVTVLDYVDISNRHFMRHDLLTAGLYSKVVIANLSAAFCDASAVNMLLEVADILAVRGTELRAVATRPLTIQTMRFRKNDERLPIFPSLFQAMHAPEQEWAPLPRYRAA